MPIFGADSDLVLPSSGAPIFSPPAVTAEAASDARHVVRSVKELKAAVAAGDPLAVIEAYLLAAQKDPSIPADILLPILFTLGGNPYTLRNHWMYAPLFRIFKRPKTTTIRAARQTGKTQNVSGQDVEKCAIIPNYKQINVTPLYEMSRRWSANYIKPLMDGCNIPGLTRESSRARDNASVLQRSFPNGSMIMFTFAYLDCERTRGIAGDEVAIDECLGLLTQVKSALGSQQVNKILPGTEVYAHNEHGNVMTDRVIATKCQGVRPTWRITLEDGRSVECTSRERLRTQAGWIYAEELIHAWEAIRRGQEEPTAAAKRNPNPDGVRDSHGRWEYASGGEETQARCEASEAEYQKPVTEVLHNARALSEGLLRAQSGSAQRVRQRAGERTGEQRLGSNQCSLLHVDHPQFRLGVRPGVPGRQETGDASVAGSDDHRGHCLVVPGRRQRVSEPDHLQHAWFQPRGVLTTRVVVDEHGIRRTRATCEEEEFDVLGRVLVTGCSLEAAGRHAAAHPAVNDLQTECSESDTILYLQPVRGNLPAEDDRCTWSVSLLQRRVPASGNPSVEAQVERTEQGLQERSRAGALSPRPRSGSREEAGASGRQACCVGEGSSGEVGASRQAAAMAGEEQGSARGEGSESCAGQGLSSEGSHRPGEEGRAGRETQRGTPATHGGSRIPGEDPPTANRQESYEDSRADRGGSSQESRAHALEYAGIESIEYIGEQEVWDVETEKHHTFFANDVAVHNCQSMQTAFIDIIREVTSGSPFGFERYTGTPKTKDNPIEKKLWRDSSKGHWLVVCDGCNRENIFGEDWDMRANIGKLGPICRFCGKALDCKPRHATAKQPASGYYTHLKPENLWRHVGYHIPQIVHPLHTDLPHKWSALIHKSENMKEAHFDNECLAISSDVGAKLVTEDQLRACAKRKVMTLDQIRAEKQAGKWQLLVCATDWSGKGKKKNARKVTEETELEYLSYTAQAVVGLRHGANLPEVLWLDRLPYDADYTREARASVYTFFGAGCDIYAHDFTGAGAVKEVLAKQYGIDRGMRTQDIMPMLFTSLGPDKPIVHFNNQERSVQYYYSLDKHRALMLVALLLQRGHLPLPEWEAMAPNGKERYGDLVSDWLSLFEETHETPRGRKMVTIQHDDDRPDDIADAITMACCAIWHITGWPELSQYVTDMLSWDQGVSEEAGPEIGTIPSWEGA